MDEAIWQNHLPLSKLSERRENKFALTVDEALRDRLVAELGLLSLRKLRFEGTIRKSSARAWQLDATLGATVEQACVVSGVPVATRIDADVTRRYLPEDALAQIMSDALAQISADGEYEMPQDDSLEPLPAEIDLESLTLEALSLVINDYPRHADAQLETTSFAAPGVTPLRDEDLNPFAALAKLKPRPDDNS